MLATHFVQIDVLYCTILIVLMSIVNSLLATDILVLFVHTMSTTYPMRRTVHLWYSFSVSGVFHTVGLPVET